MSARLAGGRFTPHRANVSRDCHEKLSVVRAIFAVLAPLLLAEACASGGSPAGSSNAAGPTPAGRQRVESADQLPRHVYPVASTARAHVHEWPPAEQRSESTLVLTQRVEHLDTLADEPMVAELPDGTLFVAGWGGELPKDSSDYLRVRRLWRSRLWKSTDHGATWSSLDPNLGAANAIGNSDVDLAVAPDGTLYFVSLLYDASTGEGQRIAIAASHDAGATWSRTVFSQHRFDDRPWVEVGPDGTAHVIWNDDSGAHWTTMSRINDRGGSSHIAIGPAGDLAVRVVPMSASGNRFDDGVDLIAVSTDGGATGRSTQPPARAAGDLQALRLNGAYSLCWLRRYLAGSSRSRGTRRGGSTTSGRTRPVSGWRARRTMVRRGRRGARSKAAGRATIRISSPRATASWRRPGAAAS